MLLVDSDPTNDIHVLADPERNFVVIIKIISAGPLLSLEGSFNLLPDDASRR